MEALEVPCIHESITTEMAKPSEGKKGEREMEVRKKKEPRQTTPCDAWQSSLATNHVLSSLCCYGFELSLKCAV